MAKLADTRFECREFSGTYGVLHRLKTVFKDGKVRSEFILAFDSAGNVVRPAVLNLSLGFCPIKDELSDIEKFVKSNKPLCYKVGEFTLLGRGALIFDEASGEVIDSSDFRLYVPKDIKTKVQSSLTIKVILFLFYSVSSLSLERAALILVFLRRFMTLTCLRFSAICPFQG